MPRRTLFCRPSDRDGRFLFHDSRRAGLPDADEIVECARAMRPFLTRPDLLGSNATTTVREIDDLVALANAGEDVAGAMLVILERHEATREWARHFMAPPPTVRGYKVAPGTPGPTPARSRYVCPKCGRVWVRRQAGEDVPDCPLDHIARVLAT